MITFSYLDKSQKDRWLPKLFDLLYDNMSVIAPGNLTYEDEKNQWLSNVSPAIDKAPRQIIICTDDDIIAGFAQYYICGDVLMIEEIQLAKSYQRTTAFYRMCRYLYNNLPKNIKYIEAYADKRNLNSISMMKKLGMQIVEFEEASPYVHFKGTTEPLRKMLNK